MLLSLALAALAISFLGALHCASMCGGFVAAAHARRPARPRGAAAAMHAGRITSYALIGGAVGAVGSFPFAFASSSAAHRFLFFAACIVLAVTGLRMAGVGLREHAPRAWVRAIGARATSLAHRLGQPRTPLRAFAFGGLWGWAPCALVYAALPLALVSGSFASGALVMAAFGLGTLPALAGAGWLLSRFSSRAARAWIGGAMVVMAALGMARMLLPDAMLPALLCAL